MKKINKRTCFCIVVFGILFLFWAIRNIQYSEKGTIDSAAVCAENGDVAISYDSNPLNVVALYDKEGNIFFSINVDTFGGGIFDMWFDDDGYLHVYIGRRDLERVYDREGNRLSQTERKSRYTKWWDGWEKKGSSYRTCYEDTTYVYEYQNKFECLFHQDTYFMIQKPDGTAVKIWTAGKR